MELFKVCGFTKKLMMKEVLKQGSIIQLKRLTPVKNRNQSLV